MRRGSKLWKQPISWSISLGLGTRLSLGLTKNMRECIFIKKTHLIIISSLERIILQQQLTHRVQRETLFTLSPSISKKKNVRFSVFRWKFVRARGWPTTWSCSNDWGITKSLGKRSLRAAKRVHFCQSVSGTAMIWRREPTTLSLTRYKDESHCFFFLEISFLS